ncbi:WecB/TagA/CpsF family glycosyltransferase [Jiulongibacter sp. NS-SX5]|uniref:WecB/TagA/CpsF family glycosyltransferase n=1 Tax=Jiulongibacter sp. NS-SX5 TaxID=3463854 RepID=UPI004057F141
MSNFLNFNITLKSFDNIVNQILTESRSDYVCVANVHMFIEAQDDLNFLELVNYADIVTADGKPLCLALKWLYGIDQERVAGMDLLPALINKADGQQLKVGFYGSTEEDLKIVSDKLIQEFPGLPSPVFISPPFRALTNKEQQDYINELNKEEVKILFVALGCPKQEKWMASMKGKINATMIGIGGALPVFAGTQKRAPLWMQKFALEWLFRLMQEPKRLFKRYFYTNSRFIYLIVLEKFKLTFNRGYRQTEFSKLGLKD